MHNVTRFNNNLYFSFYNHLQFSVGNYIAFNGQRVNALLS